MRVYSYDQMIMPPRSNSRLTIRSTSNNRLARRSAETALGVQTARTLVFLLSRHRQLAVRPGRFRLAIQRYEDLCLAVAVGRLQHLCLTDSGDSTPDRPRAGTGRLLDWVAIDLARQVTGLETARQELSSTARRRAEARARARFGAIAAAVAAEVRTYEVRTYEISSMNVSARHAAADQLTARAAMELVPASVERVRVADQGSKAAPAGLVAWVSRARFEGTRRAARTGFAAARARTGQIRPVLIRFSHRIGPVAAAVAAVQGLGSRLREAAARRRRELAAQAQRRAATPSSLSAVSIRRRCGRPPCARRLRRSSLRFRCPCSSATKDPSLGTGVESDPHAGPSRDLDRRHPVRRAALAKTHMRPPSSVSGARKTLRCWSASGTALSLARAASASRSTRAPGCGGRTPRSPRPSPSSTRLPARGGR